MTPLKLQKQALVLESDLNRLALHAELRQLRAVRTWANFLKHSGREMAPWALVLAPVGGVVVALGPRRTVRLVGLVTTVIRAVRGMIKSGCSLVARPDARTA